MHQFGGSRLESHSPPSTSKASPSDSEHRPNWIRFFQEAAFTVAFTEFSIMLLLPRFAPHLSDLAGSLVNTSILCLVAVPFLIWRIRSVMANSGAVPEPTRQNLTAPLLVLTLGLSITAFATWSRLDNLKRNRQTRFETMVDRVELMVRRRFESPDIALLGFEGMMANQKGIDREGFRCYVDALDIGHHFPGIRGFGYVERVDRENLDRWETRIRATEDTGFRVLPNGVLRDAFVIREVEPRARNAKAIGFDMSTDPIRREAIEAASRSKGMRLCGRIGLFQDDRQRPAMLAMHAIPREAGTTPRGIGTIRGVVYAAFLIDDLLEGITDVSQGMIDLEIFDSTDVDTTHTLYDMDGSARSQS